MRRIQLEPSALRQKRTCETCRPGGCVGSTPRWKTPDRNRGYKKPNVSHRDSDFAKAGAMQRAKEFPFELGWVHSLQTGSGNGCNLVAAAVDAAGDRSVYATTKSNQMKHMLRDYGFIVLSQPFPSTKDANTNLSLFIRSSPTA